MIVICLFERTEFVIGRYLHNIIFYNFELYSTQPLVAFVIIYTSPLEVVSSISF